MTVCMRLFAVALRNMSQGGTDGELCVVAFLKGIGILEDAWSRWYSELAEVVVFPAARVVM